MLTVPSSARWKILAVSLPESRVGLSIASGTICVCDNLFDRKLRKYLHFYIISAYAKRFVFCMKDQDMETSQQI